MRIAGGIALGAGNVLLFAQFKGGIAQSSGPDEQDPRFIGYYIAPDSSKLAGSSYIL